MRWRNECPPCQMAFAVAFSLALADLALVAVGQAEEDLVVIRAKEGRGTSRLAGKILDFTGRQLTLRRAGNREETVEASRVVKVQSVATAAEKTADEQFRQRNFAEAWKAYQVAYREEPRAWARRRILAQSVWCLRNTNQLELAIDLFLRLYAEDPTTASFDAIPVAWVTEPPAPGVERKALGLIAQKEPAIARLIGASWLLPTSQRAAALAALNRLPGADDSRIGFYAEAQLWRTQVVGVTIETASRWRERLARMPAEIQFGPAFVLGQAYSRLRQPEDAALMFLRAPILQPLDRELAAQGLLAAGREFETMKQPAEAARLYREVVTEHAASAAASQARDRLAKLDL